MFARMFRQCAPATVALLGLHVMGTGDSAWPGGGLGHLEVGILSRALPGRGVMHNSHLPRSQPGLAQAFPCLPPG